jgi:hypothetical protein
VEQQLYKDVARLNAESLETKRRLDQQDNDHKRHNEDIRQLFAHQEGKKAYVTQILDSIKQLETKLFTLVTQLSTGNAEERKDAAEFKEREQENEAKKVLAIAAAAERSTSLTGWQATIKDIIKMTVVMVIGYIMGGKVG